MADECFGEGERSSGTYLCAAQGALRPSSRLYDCEVSGPSSAATGDRSSDGYLERHEVEAGMKRLAAEVSDSD